MAGAQQLRLLLWKDYLIRKRKLITLIGVAWAVAVMLSLYIVRINVDNQDFPTCSFPARALPSAGLLTFLQSFICGVNNECLPMDQFEEIPTYEDSKLTQLQRKFSPLLYNETVLVTAGTVPDALKLLSTLSDIADQPTFVDISKNGLRVEDLFKRPERTKRTIAVELDLPDEVVDGLMSSDINFQGVFKGALDRCSAQSISNIINMTDDKQIGILVEKLCTLSDDQLQKIAVKLLMEVNFEKYIAMAGEMYFKLSGDSRLSRLGNTLSALLHMLKIESFLPPELVDLFLGADNDFSYFNLTIIPKILEIFEPTFGDTQVFRTINDLSAPLITGVQYLDRIIKPSTSSVVDDLRVKKNGTRSMASAEVVLKRAVTVIADTATNTSDGVFNGIAQITKLIYKFLPEDLKFEVSFYTTLFAKLMEGALKVININTHIQQMAYDVSLRNAAGVKVLTSLPAVVVGKGFDALADAERTQILTSKLNYPGQMFCDNGRIAEFFWVSKDEADGLKKKLCTNAWKDYITDLIKSFGIYEVRDNINVMASLVIQRTLGKDVSEQMYSLDKTIDVIKNFTNGLIGMNEVEKLDVDWLKLFNVTEESDFVKVVREKGHLGKQMLITVHGALAKEVVKQNALLEFKISPTLIDITTIVEAMNEELALMPVELIARLKKLYPYILQTMLLTMLNEYKTYKCLSTPSEDILCNGNKTLSSASQYLEFPTGADDDLVSTLCDTSVVIENGLKSDSVIAKAIVKVTNSSHSPLESINWTKLINNVKNLYTKLHTDLPYLFEYKTYGMDEALKAKVKLLVEEAKVFWFSWNHMDRSVHLSLKLLFRVLDLMDHEIFSITDQIWIKIKQVLSATTGPFNIITDIIEDVNALINKTESYTSKLPSKTFEALSAIAPNIPLVIVDAANIIVNDDTDTAPIISLMNADPPWPCSTTSISEHLTLSDLSKKAIKGVETLVCLDTELQQQWRDYINITTINESSPHIFLKFSSVFDSLIFDVSSLHHTLADVFNDSSAVNGDMNVVVAWKYAVEAVNATDKNVTFGNFFSKLDTVLIAINTSFTNQSTNAIWEDYIKCSNGTLIADDCKMVGRGAWKYTLQSLSVALENMADDLMTYFTEANEPESNLLQLLGFTRRTGLYILYDKLPQFVGTLINSYWDYGFMSQIRRASLSEFWDCEVVIESLIPLPGTGIDTATIEKVKPFVCPSLLHWISLPRGDNTLLDVVAKPQYYFFTLPVQNLTSSYKNAFIKATELTNLLLDIAKRNETLITEDNVKINSIQEKLRKNVDSILNYKINASDPSYRLYAELNRKQFYSMTYLIRIVATINKMSTKLENLKVDDIKTDENGDDLKKLDKELYTVQKTFKRRPTDAIALHFDLLTDIAYRNDENFKIVNALDETCNNLKNNKTNNDILNEGDRLKSQICAKNYRLIYGALEDIITKDIGGIRQTLINLRNVLQNGNIEEVRISEFLNQRKNVVKTLKSSIKHAYDFGIAIYLKYLQNSLENYNIILYFLSGEDWWAALRNLYNGPHATKFLDTVEMSCEIAADMLTKLDKIHLVRLLRDIDVNSTTSFCRPNVTLSDYIPDSAGALSSLKQRVCDTDRTEIFREIPPLVFASQGYDSDLKLSKEVDYTAVDAATIKTEANLEKIKNGPKSPQRPSWVDDEKIVKLRNVAVQLLSKESLTKIAFGVIGNVVDGSTLFLNSSQCVFCSEFTTWFKQINLQLIKKQEYDNLLCHLPTMPLEELHNTLKNEFHWDMAIRELISSRNYTKYEMNKSVNEMLEQIKLHLMGDLTFNSSKLVECLARNVSRNGFGNATIFLSVLAHTTRLIRAELPHFHEVDGLRDVPYLKKLASEVAHKLDVLVPLKNYLMKDNDLAQNLGEVIQSDLVKDIEECDVNLRLIGNYTQAPVRRYVHLSSHDWDDVCKKVDCAALSDIVYKNINKTLANKDLRRLQSEEYWRFTFVSNILHHMENIIHHASRLLGAASKLDITGTLEGRLASVIDLMMEILGDDILNGIVYSIQGIREELRPILHETPLEVDLDAVTQGLVIIQEMKKQMVEKDELKVEVSTLFSDPERLETALSRIGINNTNFWSIAAPRIHAGHLTFKPIFSNQDEYHISRFVCQPDWMEKVIHPANLDVVTSEDVHAAVVDQFCQLSDVQAKKAIVAIVQNLNYSFIIEKVKNILLIKLYTASHLTEAEGANVLTSLPQMAALLPTIQNSVGDLSDTLAKELLFQQLKDFSSVGNLLASSEFMSSAGKMICGKPFYANVNRFYKTVAQTKDFSNQPEQAQLDVLPTDFCRSLYSDIINVQGGKIVWSFVKPLLMGKILYTPDTPIVQKIIQKANESFAHMTKLTGLVHSFAKSFSSVDKLSQHREGVAALQNIINNPGLAELKSTLIGDMELPDMDVEGLFDDFGDLKGIGNLLTKASDLLQCINLNRFHPTPDEYELTHAAAKLSGVNEFSAGLVFLNANKHTDNMNNIEYKIRMDIDNVPTTARLRNYMWTPGPEASFLEDMRYFRGFIQIQDLVDRAIIDLAQNKSRTKREVKEDMKWAVYMQQTPYPCYRKDFFQTSVYESQALLVTFFFSLLYTVASAVRFMVADKESGNTMLMSVMGVDLTYHTLSWFIASFIEMTITVACVSGVLWLGGILPRTAPSLIFTILFVFGVAVLCFCYMISKLFSTASLGAVCSAILYLVTFMPIVLVLSLEAVMSSQYKILVCLSMSSALCYSFLYIARYEAMGVGAGWAQLWAAPVADGEDMSIGIAASMLIVDALLYLAIGWLIDRFFGPKTLRSSITQCVTSGEKAGVSILNITKIYNEGSRSQKLALDNVSVELHKGQITTLLGHNGAGKTTLINILTGMLKPTKGHVTVRSEHPSGTRLGVCPQKDVLFEYMTAREHVTLYAMLNSHSPKDRVAQEIDNMLQVLSLGSVSATPVCRLSGGTRRRVCVGLAFVGNPHLVVLDEPTAGVDPAARRDIWSMIVKLKEDRTILLTTHHLDEAELLSDQIVIMHKGQIHTTGSPIEIKRTLGTGYKLNVIYPKKEDISEDEEVSIEEKTKQLLTLVRDVIKNAALVDVNGVEVEIALPFFDAHGLNNNFLQLCAVLEGAQTALGFKSYSLDCSSLEQVFFNICDQVDSQPHPIEYMPEDTPSKSASSSSIRNDNAQLVEGDGPLKGTPWRQFLALLHARYIHYTRNRWLLFLLIILPSLFVTTAMAFSTIRPPVDNETALKLHSSLYGNTTEFLISYPSVHSKNVDPSFAQHVMDTLKLDKETKNWTNQETPTCKCGETRQECNITNLHITRPQMMILPNLNVTNDWLVKSQELYMEKRYGGFSAALKNNMTALIAWYNNKGHHAMPSFLSALNSAALKTIAGDSASITTYSHPMKISKEQISKDTVYQHVADAGISALVLIAYSLVSAGSAIYLVNSRVTQQKRLHYLCGVTPAMYWGVALTWDMIIIAINMVITAVVMEAFHFPVFVSKSNLPAICVLILLFGYACGNLVHLAEKLFLDSSMANMILFCGNTFLGLSGIALLLILDIISESEATDDARWVLHKIFLISPQFALGDGLLEIAKNTIQAQVLGRFGMDTYRDPFNSNLIALHCAAMVLVGTFLFFLNLAVEYDYFERILVRLRKESIPTSTVEMEQVEVTAERRRVQDAISQASAPVRLRTIGNINAGFVDTEDETKTSTKRMVTVDADVAACVGLGKVYPALGKPRVAVRALTLGFPAGQCTALLGQNGAGKSTTFAMLTGEVRPSRGQIYFHGQAVNARQLTTGHISYCPQSDAIDPLMTVRETLVMYCRLRGIAEQDDVIRRTLDTFSLSRYVRVRSGALSGGNKRKLCAAIAMMGRNQLVLLDEPTSGMDPVSRSCVWRGVARACHSRRSVVLSTHALSDARRLAARVALMRKGDLAVVADLETCLDRFGGGYIVQFVCRDSRSPRALWRRVAAAAPQASLRVLHHATVHFLMPNHCIVGKKEITTRLSDIFRLMSELQSTCDVEDYTVNQSSLDQMFLSFTDKADMDLDTVEVEEIPSPELLKKNNEDDNCTSL
ncbi:uncharacterized protein ldd [Plodia interpunctella]|uniref:uncharacterized protein ldd n=1 Tax=Plodia interpunctella TaxID=58824 RepID=UPI002368E242|nr:uncharacterized protein LOC128678721 [Plodia interpunctella]XP_053616441.1 uncharacterized protein LOC128678721 [Plodia interpunctella]